MISCNCFACVTAPVNNDISLKTGKTGVKYVQVSLSVSYYTGKKTAPYASQLYQFALFNETAEKFCDKVSRGDLITVIGIPVAGTPFKTNKGEEFTPIKMENVSWKGYSTGDGSKEEDDTTEDEF